MATGGIRVAPPGFVGGDVFTGLVKLFNHVVHRILCVDPLTASEFEWHRGRARKVLVVRTNQRIGNTLLATPGVELARTVFPEAEIHFLVHRNTQALLNGLEISKIHVFHRDNLYYPWRFVTLVRALRAERYDAVIDGGFGAKVDALLVSLCLSPCKIGASKAGSARMYHLAAPLPPKRGHREMRWDHLAQHLGVDMPSPRMRFILSVDEMRTAGGWLADHGINPDRDPVALIFPAGRSRKGKRWPIESYMETARLLGKKGVRIVIALGPDELPLRDRIEALAPAGAAILDRSSFRHVAAVLAHCDLYLGADTGLMHAACALHVPTLAVFLKKNWDRWGPQADRGQVFSEASDRSPEALYDQAMVLIATENDRKAYVRAQKIVRFPDIARVGRSEAVPVKAFPTGA